MSRVLRALIVEDSENDAELLADELHVAEFVVRHERVETAEALAAALDREAWHVVFCDFTLPRFSGKAALAIVKERDPDLPFIFVSGTIGEDVAVEAMKSGAHDYVMKGNLKRLAPAVERELREAELRRDRRRAEAERERLIAELQAAVAELKRLRGLLPICAACKKIRDEAGQWQEVEAYIQARSEVKFSQDLCPECLHRLRDEPWVIKP